MIEQFESNDEISAKMNLFVLLTFLYMMISRMTLIQLKNLLEIQIMF